MYGIRENRIALESTLTFPCWMSKAFDVTVIADKPNKWS